MGEIKSTLDLIMERTKHLSMSPEEKEEIQRQEWLKKARGWIQKFLDGQVELDRLELKLLEKEHPDDWNILIKKELLEGLEPQGDNQKRWQLLDRLLHIPLEPFLKVQNDFKRKVTLAGEERLELLKKQLFLLGISGSAIIPNLDGDPSWKPFLAKETQGCKDNWQGIIDS